MDVKARERKYKQEHKHELLTELWPDAPDLFNNTKLSEVFYVKPKCVRRKELEQEELSHIHWSVGRTVAAEIQPLLDHCKNIGASQVPL